MHTRITWGLAVLILTGCTGSNLAKPNLYVAHDTVIGVNAAVNTQRSSGRLVIGYDRDFVTIIPKSVTPPENLIPEIEGGKEAMSAVSCSKLKVTDIWLNEFVEELATGKAAQLYAESANKGENTDLFTCLKAEQKNKPANNGTS